MDHDARAGIPRKRKKSLQKQHKPTHTKAVKDPPAKMPPNQIPPLKIRPTVPVDQSTHGKIRRIPKKHKTAIDAEFSLIAGDPGYAQWFTEELNRRLKQADVGYQEINPTNKFDKTKTDVVPGMLTTGDDVTPESPKDAYMRTEEYRNLDPITQELYKYMKP